MGVGSLPLITWPLMLIVVLEAIPFLTVLVVNMEIWMFSVGDGTTAQDEKRGIDMSYIYGLIVSSSPIVTAFLADNFFGRYTLVTVHSVFILAGYILFMVSTYAISVAFWLVLTGMTLNAIGEGINRTIFPTYCADQVMSRGGESGEKMISLYYAFLQIGGMLILGTGLSKDLVKCDGKPCFKLMFGIGLASSAIALLLHFATTKWIHKQKVTNNILVKSVQCIIFAVTNRQDEDCGSNSEEKEESEQKTGTIMDKAVAKYGAAFVEDVTQAMRVCRLFFIGIPYYACYFGVFGIFVGQFYRVNAQVAGFTLTPIIYLTINPIVITISVFFIKWLTKFLSKWFTLTHLMKISVGGLVTALAYGLVFMVEMKIQQDAVPLPDKLFTLVVYRHPSTIGCTYSINNKKNFKMDSMGLSIHNSFAAANYNLTGECHENGKNISYWNNWTLDIKPEMNVIYLTRPSIPSIEMQKMTKPVRRMKSGQTEVTVFGCQKQPKSELFDHFAWKSLNRTIKYGNNSLLTSDISLKDQSGAVFVYFNGGDCSNTNGTGIYKYRLIPSYGVSIWWMLPQLLCMALVEALLTVSANEFAYSQTVPSMRSFIQALWLLTSAFGSIFGLVLNQFGLSVSTKCIVYSVAMIATTTIFAFTSRTYNYVTIDNATSPQQNEEESATNSEE